MIAEEDDDRDPTIYECANCGYDVDIQVTDRCRRCGEKIEDDPNEA